MPRLLRLPASLLGLLLVITTALAGQGTPTSAVTTITDPNYQLLKGDTLSIEISGEPDLSSVQLINQEGCVRMPLLDDLKIENLRVRQAEELLAKTYVEQELLRKPEIRINVSAYAPRLVSILGAVANPGKIDLGRDNTSVDIVDAITRSGGFTPVAKRDQVTVLRSDENGREESFTVDVDAMMRGKRGPDSLKEFMLLPGDRVIVKERVF